MQVGLTHVICCDVWMYGGSGWLGEKLRLLPEKGSSEGDVEDVDAKKGLLYTRVSSSLHPVM